jgi:Raf kinase inhibitor-like YbhB/YbcL family protein
MKLSSPAFEHEGEIPRAYTCDGDDVSPPLEWSGVPADAKSLALIVDDPDAPDPDDPKLTWVHWLLYDLPPKNGALPVATKTQHLPAGTLEGCNDWQRTGYCGPCPPVGRHRYFFKLYALDILLPDLHHPDKAGLEKAMKGHITGETELIGMYRRKPDLARTGEH